MNEQQTLSTVTTDTDVLVVLGCDDSYFHSIVEWVNLKISRTAIFIETDYETFRLWKEQQKEYFLHSEQSRLWIVYLESEDALKQVISWICHKSLLQRVEIFPQSRDTQNTDYFEMFSQTLTLESCSSVYLGNEFWDFGERFYRNFYHNLFEMPHTYCAHQIAHQMKNIPVVICGAGPSLKKNYEVLRHIKDRALIIAAGSTISILTKEGIVPHIGVALDPLEEEWKRLKDHCGYEMPLYYSNRIHHRALKLFHGPLNYLYADYWHHLILYCHEVLGIESLLENEFFYGGGCSSTTVALCLAHSLSPSQRILCGVDLAYTDNIHYSGDRESSVHLKEGSSFWKAPIQKQDLHGHPIYTRWEWLSEAQWISEHAATTHHVPILNATGGGLPIEGVRNISLEDLKSQRQFPIDDAVHAMIQSSKWKISENVIENFFQQLRESLDRSAHLVDLLLENSDQIQSLWKEYAPKNLLRFDLGFLHEIELEDEIAYKMLLRPMEVVVRPIFLRHVDALVILEDMSEEEKAWLRQLHIDRRRLYYLKDAITAHLKWIQEAFDGRK